MGVPKRTLISAKLNGTEKRYKPSKHYVYILQVAWSDGTEYVIYRKYSQFYDFQITLIDMFPIEAGYLKVEERILPHLPGRRLFQRSEVQRVATKRQLGLGEYCEALLKLEAKISQCPHVHSFFEPKSTDISPPKEVRQRTSRLLSALLPILPGKHRTKIIGSHGDGSRAPSEDDIAVSSPLVLEEYEVVADFTAEDRSQVSLTAGQVVEVVEKTESGWWFIQFEGFRTGWAPASFLDPINRPDEVDESPPCYAGEKFITRNSYEGQLEDEISFPKNVIVDVMHKLLDGWWVVSYNGQVGHAPAMHLIPYKNPHLRPTPEPSPSMPVRKQFKPIPRRCTLQKTSSKWKERSIKRDLTLYRKYSDKIKPINPSDRESRPLPPPPQDVVADLEDTELVFQTQEELEEKEDELDDYVNVGATVDDWKHQTGSPTDNSHVRCDAQNDDTDDEYPGVKITPGGTSETDSQCNHGATLQAVMDVDNVSKKPKRVPVAIAENTDTDRPALTQKPKPDPRTTRERVEDKKHVKEGYNFDITKQNITLPVGNSEPLWKRELRAKKAAKATDHNAATLSSPATGKVSIGHAAHQHAVSTFKPPTHCDFKLGLLPKPNTFAGNKN